MKTNNASEPGAKRWMLVEDNEEALQLMRQILVKAGITQVECFSSSHDALAAFEAAPESFEMVITDFVMPGLDGIELARQMFRLAPKIKILLVTGSDSISHESAGQEGFCGLLQKPFHVESLRAALDAVTAGKFFTSPMEGPSTGF